MAPRSCKERDCARTATSDTLCVVHGMNTADYETPSLSEVLRHMEKYATDWQIYNDLDSFVAAVVEQDEDAIRRYARARRNAPGFAPGKLGSSNHRAIALSLLWDIEYRPSGDTRCASCGRAFRAKRATARYCSDRCRQRSKRARGKAGVTP